MRIVKYFLLLLSFLVPAHSAFAVVQINEISSYQSSGDWIELFADQETDISGWVIKDDTSEIKTIPTSTKIGTPSASFLVISVSNRLNRDKDLIELYRSDKSSLVDSISYGYEDAICAAGDGNAIGRLPELTNNWVRFLGSTQAASNSGELSICPVPSPSPTLEPSPSPSPSPSPTATPIPSPSPTPSPKPSHKPSPTPSPSADLEPLVDGTVAGETIDLSAFTASPVPSSSPSPAPKSLTLRTDRVKNLLMIGGGLVLLSLSGYFGYRKYLDQGKIGE